MGLVLTLVLEYSQTVFARDPEVHIPGGWSYYVDQFCRWCQYGELLQEGIDLTCKALGPFDSCL